ncbi:MAG: hypothetical protein GXP62_22105, partial [Oligoflexia bacterium]|nr:hypothetical protein [Oligoflexia bacterium]
MKRSTTSGGHLGAGLLLWVLFGSGCVADLGTMSRLQAAYGDETSALMSPAIQGTMALGALSADACVATREGTWSDLTVGSDLPLSKGLSEVIGDPVIDSYSYLTTIQVGAAPVRLAGLDDARLVLTIVTASPVLVTGKVTDASGDTTLADFAFEIVGDCTADWARVSGDATWTLDGIDH